MTINLSFSALVSHHFPISNNILFGRGQGKGGREEK